MRRMNTRTLVLSSSLRCIDSFWFACRITSQSSWTLNISQPSFLPQARPDLGSWQVLLLFSLFFPASQAMWEGDDVFAKVWQTASNILFSVESDSYGISFQRNGIINDHRLIQNSFNWPFLPWTSSSFVGFKDSSFSVQNTRRLKILTLITSVWTFGVSDQDSRKRPPRSLSARGSSYTTWYVSWKQCSKSFHDFWLEKDRMFT